MLRRPTSKNLITHFSDDDEIVDEIQQLGSEHTPVHCCGPYIIQKNSVSGPKHFQGVYTLKNSENGPKIIQVEISNELMAKFGFD